MESKAAGRTLVTGLSVVYLYVKDMQRAQTFYRDVLGVPLTVDDHWAEANLGGVRFALHEWHEGAPEPGESGIKVDLEVQDIDAAAEHLRAHGVALGEIFREPYGSFCTFVDPEGYRLELFEPPHA